MDKQAEDVIKEFKRKKCRLLKTYSKANLLIEI